jgi:hypothetical protein
MGKLNTHFFFYTKLNTHLIYHLNDGLNIILNFLGLENIEAVTHIPACLTLLKALRWINRLELQSVCLIVIPKF